MNLHDNYLDFENNIQNRRGSIEIITGSMFSGKTEELIRRLKRAQIAKLKVEIFKPDIDIRYNSEAVVSHDENSILSTSINMSSQILLYINNIDVVGIDEAQFFDDELVHVCNYMANRGIRVIVAGLDMNFAGEPFGPIPNLLAIAEHITKVHAICMKCGNLANFSYRKSADSKIILIGEKDNYEPLCRKCYEQAKIKNNEKQ